MGYQTFSNFDDTAIALILMPLAVIGFGYWGYRGMRSRSGPRIKANEKYNDVMTLQKDLSKVIREQKLKPSVDALLAEAGTRLGGGTFQVNQPADSPGFAILRSVRKPEVRISVDTLGQKEGCYSIQVNSPDATVALIGETIKFSGHDLSRAEALDILVRYL